MCTLCWLCVSICPSVCLLCLLCLWRRVSERAEIERRVCAEVCCSVTSNISYGWFNVLHCWLAASSNKAFPQSPHHTEKTDLIWSVRHLPDFGLSCYLSNNHICSPQTATVWSVWTVQLIFLWMCVLCPSKSSQDEWFTTAFFMSDGEISLKWFPEDKFTSYTCSVYWLSRWGKKRKDQWNELKKKNRIYGDLKTAHETWSTHRWFKIYKYTNIAQH